MSGKAPQEWDSLKRFFTMLHSTGIDAFGLFYHASNAFEMFQFFVKGLLRGSSRLFGVLGAVLSNSCRISSCIYYTKIFFLDESIIWHEFLLISQTQKHWGRISFSDICKTPLTYLKNHGVHFVNFNFNGNIIDIIWTYWDHFVWQDSPIFFAILATHWSRTLQLFTLKNIQRCFFLSSYFRVLL